MPLVQLYLRHFPFPAYKSLLWRHFNWREKIYRTRTTFGSLMIGRTTDHVQGYIYYFGVWEPSLTRFIQSRLNNQTERTFVDVGANVGYFSLLAAKSMPNGHVVSIEAFPSIYTRLLENIKINNYMNVRAVNCAATEDKCSVSMYHAGADNEGATTSVEGKFQSTPIQVDGYPLTEILSESEVATVRLIKIDVEGAEYSVLRGLYPLLSRLPADVEIAVEITPAALGDEKMSEIFSIFRKEGFFPYVLFNSYDPKYYMNSRAPVKPVRMDSLPVKQTDIIFSKTDADSLQIQF